MFTKKHTFTKRRTRAPAKRLLCLSLATATIFTAALSGETITALAAESTETETFIPYRSYYVSYLAEHSSEANSAENVYLWCKMLGEQISGTTNASANNWFSTYHSETILPGGTYLSDEQAASNYVYSTSGVSNAVYDQMLANLIKANGTTFLNAWINGYTDANGNTLLSAANGKDSFIKFFDNEYSSFKKTAAAVVELTKTTAGNTWLQNYTYAKTGSVEASVGVTILKLFCADFDDLNDTQISWAKAYLPYLLSDYASKGSSGLAASTKNAYLYDFMARSVNGAQSTLTKASSTTVSANGVSLGTVASGTKLQQEFFNYVVASATGFGSFIQNIIGGGKYTGAYSNSYDLSSYETAQSVIMTPDADIDYYTSTAGGGDKDTDWFNHAMYLYSAGSGYSQFATVYNLMKNNSTTLAYYSDWLSRFGSKKGVTRSWNYLANQTTGLRGGNGYQIKDSNYAMISYYDWSDGSHTGYVRDGDPAQLYLISYSTTLAHIQRCQYSWCTNPPSVNGSNYAWTWYTPLTQDVVGANRFTISFRSAGSAMGATVQILNNGTSGSVAASGEVWVSAGGSNSITLTTDGTAKSYYLRVIPTGINSFWRVSGQQTFEFYITGVTCSFNSTSKCLNGHNYNNWQTDYSEDFTSATLHHECSNCGVEEREILSLSNGKVTKVETDAAITYTYKPTILTSKSPWTKVISKDLGSGSVTFSSGSSGTSGTWSVTKTNTSRVQAHMLVNGTWYSVSSTTAIASGTVAIASGTIKQNVQSITAYLGVSGNTTGGRQINILVYDTNGNVLKNATATNANAYIDLTGYSNSIKEGLYIVVTHTNTYERNNMKAGNWDDYPSYPDATATSIITKIVATY